MGYHNTAGGLLGRPNEPFVIFACFLSPEGFGNLTIDQGADPFADPIVHTDILGDANDFNQAVQCSEDFSKIIRKGFSEDFGMVEYGPSNAFPAESWVAATTQTSWHFVDSSAVGSVVDGDFKLLGGLTCVLVVDASIMPKLPISGGPLSSVYMLAEFASDRLVDQYASLFGSSKS